MTFCNSTPAADGALKGSLLHHLDRTATGFGSRLLRRWVAAPLAERGLIQERLDAVQVCMSLFLLSASVL